MYVLVHNKGDNAMTDQRRCLLPAAEMHLSKYLVYKLRRKTRMTSKLLFGGYETGIWRVSFMGAIIAAGHSFDEVVKKAWNRRHNQ
jgi:hypothetical protein